MSSSESMRWWLITSTTYGSWLPGDRRGFVSTVTDEAGNRVRHNLPGAPYDADMPLLEKASRQLLKCPPIRLRLEQAEALRDQFFETATVRGWRLLAIAIMSNHFQVVIGAGDATEPEKVLGDLKSYGSRALSNRWGKPVSGTWWNDVRLEAQIESRGGGSRSSQVRRKPAVSAGNMDRTRIPQVESKRLVVKFSAVG